MNSSELTICFESLVFPEEELEKDDVLQSRGSMKKELMVYLWSCLNGYRYGFTALCGKPYPKTGLTTSKEFTTQTKLK